MGQCGLWQAMQTVGLGPPLAGSQKPLRRPWAPLFQSRYVVPWHLAQSSSTLASLIGPPSKLEKSAGCRRWWQLKQCWLRPCLSSIVSWKTPFSLGFPCSGSLPSWQDWQGAQSKVISVRTVRTVAVSA